MSSITHTLEMYLESTGNVLGDPGLSRQSWAQNTLLQPAATSAFRHQGDGPDPLVHFQSILVLEAFATLRAGEGPAVRVNAPVTEEQGRVGEAAAAVGAGVGPLSCVRAPVDGQQVRVSEATLAVRAWIGLFTTRMDELMLEQVLALGERGLALVTGERPLPSVDPLVAGQQGRVAEVSITV